jgi:hypothetical protein
MCNVSQALSRAFSFGSGHAANALLEAQGEAQQSADTATAAMQKALKDMQAASMPAIDNPAAHVASLDQQRKLLASQGAAWSFGNTPTAAPVTGTKVLLGS